MDVDTSKPTEIHHTTSEELEPVPCTSTHVSESRRLGNCEVCAVNSAKYTCPRCEVKTCCLRCSTIHKKELECNGARDRAKFIPLNKFTDLDLSNDYRLLEEISRSLEGYKKDKTRRFLQNSIILPHFFYKLKNAAHDRCTTLTFLPPNFARHRQNTTRLNYARNTIFWRVDWIFPNAENLKLVDEKVRETEKLANVLQKYFKKQDSPILQERLQYYQSLGMNSIKAYLRAEQKPGNKYYELELNESLKENLKGKVIIEYPTVLVLNKEHVSAYETIDSDDEDVDEKSTSGQVIIERMLKRQESEESLYSSLRNLLFVSENSDNEGMND